MTKKELKQKLEEYWYNHQYYLEGSKDILNIMTEIDKLSEQSKCTKDKISTPIFELRYNSLIKKHIRRENDIVDMLTKEEKIERYINLAPQPYHNIFYYKYVKFLSFGQIADRMNYSTKRIYQLHQEGLEILLDLINEKGEESELN